MGNIGRSIVAELDGLSSLGFTELGMKGAGLLETWTNWKCYEEMISDNDEGICFGRHRLAMALLTSGAWLEAILAHGWDGALVDPLEKNCINKTYDHFCDPRRSRREP